MNDASDTDGNGAAEKPGAEPPAGTRKADDAPAGTETEIDAAILDLTFMREAFGEINESALELFRLFRDSLDQVIQQLREQLDARDSEAALHSAHAAKSQCHSVGAREMATIFAGIEKALREGDDTLARGLSGDIPAAWERLDLALRSVSPE